MISACRSSRFALAWVAVLVAVSLGISWAQGTPRIALVGPDTVVPGDVVAIEVEGLPDDVVYELRVEAPDGGERTRSVRSAAGRVRADVALDLVGRHVLWLEGPDLQARFAVRVESPPDGPGPPVGEGDEPGDAATPSPDGEAAPGTPDADAPEATEPGVNEDPDAAEPDATEPDTTQPDASEPDASEPGAAEPGAAEPGAAEPDATESRATEPEAAEPGVDEDPDPAAVVPPAKPDADEPDATDPGPTDPGPASAEPEDPAAADEAGATDLADGLTLLVEDDVVVARDADGDALWRLSFAPGSGGARQAITHLGRGWVAVGHQVLTVDLATGAITDRVATSGPVVDLRPVGTGLSVLSEVATPDTQLNVEARLVDGVVTPTPVFDPTSQLFDSLVNEAGVADPTGRLAIDPTNPFLHLAAARGAATDTDRDASIEAALAAATTFYDYARLARAFAAQGWWEDADRAMALAAADFRDRGYDPALLTSVEVHERYGFPRQPLEGALGRGDLTAADLWARWTYELSGPDLPGVGSALRQYASALASAEDRTGAALWRERAGERTNPVVGDVIARASLALGGAGRYAVGALLVAFLALHLTLMAKYARARALAIRQAREAGRRVPAWPWTRTIRYYGLTEKLVLLLLLASVVVVVALAGWTQRTEPQASLIAAGHLHPPALAAYGADPLGDPLNGAWVEAYRADRAGDPERARAVLDEAGVASDRALAAAGAGEPVPAPSPAVVRAAAGGTWFGAIARPFRDPLSLLDDDSRLDGIARWAWPALVVIFALVVVLHVLVLFVPRPRLSRHAPRPLGYHVLALLLPGSGQADELYGVLLLIPWAVFGIDVLVQLMGTSTLLGIRFGTGTVVLAVLYVVNLVAWAVELGSVRKRQRVLRETEPELAHAYGLARAPRRQATPVTAPPASDG